MDLRGIYRDFQEFTLDVSIVHYVLDDLGGHRLSILP